MSVLGWGRERGAVCCDLRQQSPSAPEAEGLGFQGQPGLPSKILSVKTMSAVGWEVKDLAQCRAVAVGYRQGAMRGPEAVTLTAASTCYAWDSWLPGLRRWIWRALIRFHWVKGR